MPKENAFFIGLVGEAKDSFNCFEVYFLEVDAGEHFLNAAPNLAHLIVFSKVVEHNQGFVQGKIERLAASLKDILHSAVVDDPEYHFAASNFNKFGIGFQDMIIITLFGLLKCDEVRNLIIFGSLEVALDGQLVRIFQLHGCVGVKTFAKIQGQILAGFIDSTLLKNKCFGDVVFFHCLLLLLAACFFLYYQPTTLRPPIFGILLFIQLLPIIINQYYLFMPNLRLGGLAFVFADKQIKICCVSKISMGLWLGSVYIKIPRSLGQFNNQTFKFLVYYYLASQSACSSQPEGQIQQVLLLLFGRSQLRVNCGRQDNVAGGTGQ